MEPVKQTQKKYGSRALILAIAAGFLIMAFGYKPEAKGLILGTLFSVLNFVLIGETLPLRLGRSKRAATLIAFGSILLRFVLMAVPLVVAIRYPQFNVFTVIPGLLMVQLTILADHIPAGLIRKPTRQMGEKI